MRTKLDEIVEEELSTRRACGGFEPLNESCARIAERAFRHGVERGVATAPYMMDGRSYIVQPEPVGEKKRGFENCVIKMRDGETLNVEAPYFNGYTIKPNEECGMGEKGIPPFAYDPARVCDAHRAGMDQSVPCWPDRRKGQRRKGIEVAGFVRGYPKGGRFPNEEPIYMMPGRNWAYDRRIKDRRKA